MLKTIHAAGAPAAIGPYSHAVLAGELLFASGQIGLVPESSVLAGEDVESQTHQVFQNVKAILSAAGLTLGNVVKTTVFLTDLKNFPLVNEIYASYFPQNPPARSCVQVAALPANAKIEMEIIAKV
ncbi:MAG: Rid family detoxifying hydrolase [Oscillospiraceae bacterium]|nr:Rid family detoxifying hydrolase [Oscillospiraceae bacterium]